MEVHSEKRLMEQNPRALSSNSTESAGVPRSFVRVAVAVVYRWVGGRPSLFVARRPDHAIRGGLWEFPGGKIEQGEAPSAAALRELEEEVGLSGDAVLRAPEPLVTVTHTDPDLSRERSISLEAFLVEVRADAVPSAPASVEVRWISVDDIGKLEWPRANHAINAAIRARFGAA
ncbi:MAG: NUDIX domain-containing protein [Phycisphaera sp.]|nr:NUDIX domain-containing protein [Phycisphaera sp.]